MNITLACRALAHLVDGKPPDQPIDGLSAADATHWYQANKYPLLALVALAPDWLRDDPTFQHELAIEQEWFDTQRDEYLILRQAWLDHGITCLMIKSAGNQPSFPYTSDNMDIEVRPHHGPAARQILRDLGYVEVRTVEEPQKFLFRLFRGGRCVSAIHVHERVAWDVGFMDENALWARMRPAVDDPLVNVPSPEDAILINLAHANYENKRLRLNDLARVRYALRAAGHELDWEYMHQVAATRGWLDGLAFLVLVYASLEPALFGSQLVPDVQQARFAAIIEAVPAIQRQLSRIRARANVDLPLLLPYWFCKRLHYSKILTDPTLSVGRRWYDAFTSLAWGIKLKARLRPQHGMLISVSGPDGAGKTTHAEALVEALDICTVSTNYVWNRGGSTGLLALTQPLSRGIGTPGNPDRGDPLARRQQRLSSAGPVVRFAWAWLVALDQVIVYNLHARLPTMVGRVVVMDRYAYDTAVEMDMALPADARGCRLAVTTMLKLVPRPQLAYVLDVSPATARQRKPQETWHAELEAERARYRALADRLGLRLLSTEGTFSETNDAWLREVVMTYMADFETWLNGVFWANPSQMNVPDLVWAEGTAR